MDVREKLVELLKQTPIANINGHTAEAGVCFLQRVFECFANYLIANGVTVQEWISVEDRLPEKNTSVVAATDNGIVFQCLYAYDGWDLWEGNNVNITHWQPMPQPPKGE